MTNKTKSNETKQKYPVETKITLTKDDLIQSGIAKHEKITGQAVDGKTMICINNPAPVAVIYGMGDLIDVEVTK